MARHDHRSTSARRAAPRRQRDARGRFLNPSRSSAGRRRTGGGRSMNPSYDNPFVDSAGRRHRNDGKFAASPGRRSGGTGRGGARSSSEHAHRSAGARRAIQNRQRDARGRLMNPTRDRAGRMHDDDGQFMNPFDSSHHFHGANGRFASPSRGRGASAKGRKRDARGRFLNPPSARHGGGAMVMRNHDAWENPFTDRAGRRHRDDGRFMASRGSRSGGRGRSASASNRPRDAQGRFLNPSHSHRGGRSSRGGAMVMRNHDAWENPFTDRAGRRHRDDGRFMGSGGGRSGSRGRSASTANRRRDAQGRFLNPSHGRSSVGRGMEHMHRSAGARRAIRGRSRNELGQLQNPFDGHGFFHDELGKFSELPTRKYARKRSEFSRGVASHRGRRANGTFKNPSSRTRGGAGRRSSGRGSSLSDRPRDSRGRLLPTVSHRYANPFDSRGRFHDNSGRFAPSGRGSRSRSRSRSRGRSAARR